MILLRKSLENVEIEKILIIPCSSISEMTAKILVRLKSSGQFNLMYFKS